MSTITVGELARRLRDAATAWAPALRAELRLGGEDATARVRRLAAERLTTRTGRLLGSLQGEVRDLTLSVHGGAGIPYLVVQEAGATIRARSPGGMRFQGVRGWRRADQVRIPGRRFVADAGREAGDRLAGRISARLAALLEGTHGQ